MTRGTKFLNNSTCSCGRHDRTVRPYGHITKVGVLILKGYCRSCNGKKSLPHPQEQLNVEGEGIKKFFKDVWTKAIGPLVKNMAKNVLKNPVGAFQLASQIGAAATSKTPQAIMNAGLQTGRFITKGGAAETDELTSSQGLLLHPRR